MNGILLALLAREKTGRGQKIEQSLLDAIMTTLLLGLSSYFSSGKLPSRMGSEAPYVVPNGAFSSKDGYNIMMAANLEPKWASLSKLLNKIKWLEDRRFRTNKDRVENWKILIPILEEILKTLTTVPITTYEDLKNLEQVKPNEMNSEMDILEKHPPMLGSTTERYCKI